MRTCEISECENVHLAKGLCRKHYLRMYKKGTLELTVFHGSSAYDRLIKNSKSDDNGCLVFQGCKNENGYGQIRDGKMRAAHRVAFEHHNGPIPDDMELDHLCRNRACINHLHMEVVTHKENVQRGVAGHDHHLRERNNIGQFC